MLGRSINRKRHSYFTSCGRKLNLLKDVLEMLFKMLPESLVLYFFTCISHAFFLTIFVFHVTEDVFIIVKQNIAKWGTRKKCSHVLKKKKVRKVLPLIIRAWRVGIFGIFCILWISHAYTREEVIFLGTIFEQAVKLKHVSD